MRIKSHPLPIVLWTILGLSLLLINLANSQAQPGVQSAPPTPTPSAQTTEITTTEDGTEEEIGSTDGIVLMAVIIMLIVLVPILVHWRIWAENGKKKG